MFGNKRQNDSTPTTHLISEIKAVLREVRSSQDAHTDPAQHIRIKQLMSAVLEGDLALSEKLDRLDAMAVLFTEKFAQHTQKETQILYPASLELFSDEEWSDITEECDNLGYFTDTIGATK